MQLGRLDFQIWNLTRLSCRAPILSILDSLGEEPIIILLVSINAEGDWCKPLSNTTEREEEEVIAAAREISLENMLSLYWLAGFGMLK